MEKSLDKTRDTVKARVKLPSGRTVDVVGKAEVPVPPTAPGGETGSARVIVTPGDRPTELMPAATVAGPAATQAVPATGTGSPRSRRRLLVMTGFTVVIFALGMLAITGLELVKGSPLNTSASTAQRPGGTSLGSVLGSDPGAAATETTEETTTESETETEEPSEEEQSSTESTSEEDAEQTDERRSGDEEEPTPTRSPRVTPTPTPESGSGSGSDTGGGGAAPNAQSGGGADRDDAGTNGAG
jgi:septal ring-binding cell division protein DamX